MPGDIERDPRLADLLLNLWRLSRPEVWTVSVLPMYVGWLMASRELMPGLELWTGFWARAAFHGQTVEEFALTLASTLYLAWPLIVAALVMGPILWTATLLINDVYDLPGDRRNPRKARSLLVQGVVSTGHAHLGAYAAAAAAVALALAVGVAFAALVAVNLALAWAYSVPPVRLKTRPGADVLVNALGIGLISILAGWSIERPLAEFPVVLGVQGLLVAIAIYVPTTLVDHDADARAGYFTLATHLGPSRAYRIGWTAWTVGNLGAIVLAYTDTLLPRGMLPILVLFVPVLLFEYHMLIGKAGTPAERVRGIAVTALTFLSVNLVFALMHAGMWIS